MTSVRKKILYVFDYADRASRLPVAHKAQEQGFHVTLALIGPVQDTTDLKDFDNHWIEPSTGKMSLGGMMNFISRMKAILRQTQPDLLHAVTIKYAFLCGIAALRYSSMKKLYTLAGLGYLFRGSGNRAALYRIIAGPLLKKILTGPAVHLIFQNPDDQALMIDSGYAVPDRSHLIRGSGVDLGKFNPELPPHDQTPLVLMPTRLVQEKGIHIFVHAAHILKDKNVKARFQIAGGETQDNPKAISADEMQALTADGVVEWLGRVDDMPGLLQRTALVVYPSYYGEGIPRVLLEAAAAGRAIITTDHPGCREAVEDGESGILVPIRDAKETARAIETLLNNPDQCISMGQAGRKKAENEFNIDDIASITAQTYKRVLVTR